MLPPTMPFSELYQSLNACLRIYWQNKEYDYLCLMLIHSFIKTLLVLFNDMSGATLSCRLVLGVIV